MTLNELALFSDLALLTSIGFAIVFLSFRWPPCSELKLPDKTSLAGSEIKEDGAKLFSVVPGGTSGSRHKLKYMKFHVNIRKAYLLEGLSNTGAC